MQLHPLFTGLSKDNELFQASDSEGEITIIRNNDGEGINEGIMTV